MAVFLWAQWLNPPSPAGRRCGRPKPLPSKQSLPRLEALEERLVLSPYSDAVLADQPSGYWRLGEPSGPPAVYGPSAVDSSGFARHGTYVGGPIRGEPGAIVNDPDTAAAFDGSKSFVNVAGTPFNYANNFTLEAWVRNPGQPPPVGRIISNGQPGSRGYGWGLLPDDRIRFTTYGILDYDANVTVPRDGAYHHVVVTLDASNTASFYLDGLFQQVIAGPLPARPSELNFSIGRNPPGSDPPTPRENWLDRLDEVAVYATVLSSERIAVHYRVGTGGEGAPGVPGSSLPDGLSPQDLRALSTDRPFVVPLPLAGDLTGFAVAERFVPAMDSVGIEARSAPVPGDSQGERSGQEAARVDLLFASLGALDGFPVGATSPDLAP